MSHGVASSYTREIPCYECGKTFTQHRRSPSHYCKPCRVLRHRESTKNRYHQVRHQAEEIVSRLPEEVSVSYEVYAIALSMVDGAAMTRDRQPTGTKSPRGADDGRSTFFTDLAGELDRKCAEAAEHAWWNENPHWAIDL